MFGAEHFLVLRTLAVLDVVDAEGTQIDVPQFPRPFRFAIASAADESAYRLQVFFAPPISEHGLDSHALGGAFY